jgi:hypothetical protein
MPAHPTAEGGRSSAALWPVAMLCFFLASSTVAQQQNWTHFVRIGAYGLHSGNVEAIVRDAQKSHVFGIEVDNDIPGRYESFLDPTQKLTDIRATAEAAHRVGNKAFVYIAGTECITANAEKSPHSLAKDHPGWLQRNRNGDPAIFSSGAAFWIRPGDEDVWVSPLATEWRRLYMERVRQIAATGIDGIYVDIPYWMTHFDGWENTWASFDEYTVAAFQRATGLDARRDLKLGNFSDANFRKWVDFRMDTLTDFVREIHDTAHAVNPSIMLIPEIYPGIEQEAVRVGADVYQMYGVADAIAHEYEFGESDHLASSRSQLDWFLYQAGMLTFRAFAEGKATWILNYSWDGDKRVDAREAMKNLAMSQVMAGANFWDAPGHSMAGSNDLATRSLIFQWIEKNEKTLYSPRIPMHPVGVYFSPKSRDYDAGEFLPAYRGTLLLLLQAHREFQVVTPRTVEQFSGALLVLPNVSVLSDAEKSSLQRFLEKGGRLVLAGKETHGLCNAARSSCSAHSAPSLYFEGLQHDFTAGLRKMPQNFLETLRAPGEIEIDAAPTVAANFARVNGVPHIFLANFSGLVPGKIAAPSPQDGIRVRIPAAMGDSLAYLPFLGETRIVHGEKQAEHTEFALPSLERGAVVWIIGKN